MLAHPGAVAVSEVMADKAALMDGLHAQLAQLIIYFAHAHVRVIVLTGFAKERLVSFQK